MATNDKFIETKPSVEVLGSIVSPSENEIQCAARNKIVAADTAGVLRLPAGAVVTSFHIQVITAEGGAATADIGIRGGSATQFFNDVNLNATGVTYSSTPNYKNVSGAEEIVELDPSAELDTVQFVVFAVVAFSELSVS